MPRFAPARLLALAAVCAAAIAAVLATAAAATNSSFKVLFLSDLHLDIHYGTDKAGRGPCTKALPEKQSTGSYGCDSPQKLIDSAVTAAAQFDSDASLVLVSGDHIRHDGVDLSTEEQQKTVRDIVAAFNRSFGADRVAFNVKPSLTDVLGNNDMTDDYAMNLTDGLKPVLSALADSMSASKFLSPSETDVFRQCGFYTRVMDIPGSKKQLQLINFNSVIYNPEFCYHHEVPATDCKRLQDYNASEQNDPCGQLAFIEAALADARKNNRAVITNTHVPPGMDLHDATTELEANARIENASFYWLDVYDERFRRAIKANRDIVRLMVYGHTHHVGFIADTDLGVPALVVGAVSPVYANAPMFASMLFDLDELRPDFSTLRQIAFANFPSATPVWKETAPSFAELYGMPRPVLGDAAGPKLQSALPFDVVNQKFFAPALRDSCTNTTRTLRWYNYSAAYGKAQKTCDAKCMLMTYCFSTSLTRALTEACYNRGCPASGGGDDGTLSEGARIAIGICTVTLAIVLLFVFFRARRGGRAKITDADACNLPAGGGAAQDHRDGSSLNSKLSHNSEHEKLQHGAAALYSTSV